MSTNIINVAKAYLIVLLGTGGARAVAFLTSIILARKLGAESFGQFSLFQSAMFICWQMPQAFDTAFIRYAKSEDSQMHIKECLAAATRLKIYFALLMLLSAYPVMLAFEHFKADGGILGKLAAAGIICGSFLCFLGSIANLMRVKEQFGRFSIVQGIYNLTIFLIVVLLAYVLKTIDLKNSITIFLFVAFIYGALSLYLVYRISGNPFKAPAELNRLIFKISKWILPTVVAFYFFARIDILMLSSAISFTEVGIYSVAGQLVLVVTLIISAASTVFMPRSIPAIRSREAFKDYIKESIIPILLILLGISFLYAAAPWIFTILFTAEYSGATKILRILLLGYVAVALYTPLSFLFYAIDRPNLRFYLEGLKLVMAILLLYFIIPIYGARGAAWAMSITMAFNSVLSAGVLFLLLKKAVPAHSGTAAQ